MQPLKKFNGIFVAAIISVSVLVMACTLPDQYNANHAPIVEKLNVEHSAVYPLGNTIIECVAVDPLGHPLKYTWACNDGKIIGSGSKITWEAPASYGDYYLMVTVDDGAGGVVNKTATVSVLVRPPDKNCPLCPK